MVRSYLIRSASTGIAWKASSTVGNRGINPESLCVFKGCDSNALTSQIISQSVAKYPVSYANLSRIGDGVVCCASCEESYPIYARTYEISN